MTILLTGSKPVAFNDLRTADLVVDCMYQGGPVNQSGEVLSKLIPGCSNSGGFRKVLCKNDKKKIAYVVLFTTMTELEWPDYLDRETGIFRYFGDNRTPGQHLTDTRKKGNLLLEEVFKSLNTHHIDDIPPFLIFQKGDKGKDVKFLGLAVPGTTVMSPDKELVAFWRTLDENRFQNYVSYFTVLDTEQEPITRQWLEHRLNGDPLSDTYAPKAWKLFQQKGRAGIVALTAAPIKNIPTAEQQLNCQDDDGFQSLINIRNIYEDDPYGFEACATEILMMSDNHFDNFYLTRPWRDGGRDAIGKYVMPHDLRVNNPLRFDCAMEAKCYSPNHSVGVHEMSRLISRIKHRQFGALVTTSYVNNQAYKEVKEDQHPILILTATNIAAVLRANSIHSGDIAEWCDGLKQRYPRMG
jgi:hypothetical protein